MNILEENITHSAGCYYSIENNGTINIVRVESSTSYPKTRTYVIKDETALNEAYFTAPEIDFEKEMLLIHFYTDICDNGAYFKMVKIDENNVLKIEYALEPDPPGLGGTSGPFQAILVVKANKLDVSEVEFIYDNYYMDHIVEQNS